MPELPEVEVLVRHLARTVVGALVHTVWVPRPKMVAPATIRSFADRLRGARFLDVRRRGKYLLFSMQRKGRARIFPLIGHLGMTGRMYLAPAGTPQPKHAAVVLGLGDRLFVFEDPRGFGRLMLDASVLDRLGPEPLDPAFDFPAWEARLRRSRQAIKVRLLDQTLMAGVGNIYASEALFRAGLWPRTPASRLRRAAMKVLHQAVCSVLEEAIRFGSTVPLDWAGRGVTDGLFYYGRAEGATESYAERLAVYGRAGLPCPRCGASIRRLVQAARSTFYCPRCQRSSSRMRSCSGPPAAPRLSQTGLA